MNLKSNFNEFEINKSLLLVALDLYFTYFTFRNLQFNPYVGMETCSKTFSHQMVIYT